MIGLLGRHLYSRPQVFVRELLQNAVDAITARARLTGNRSPGWGVRLGGAARPGDPVWCVDDGVGMTLAEAREVLSVVGRSSKRDALDLAIGEYLGQFGIGLLSCFMVTDRVVVRTRSATGAAAVEWVGYASGLFTATEIADDLPVGTRVEFVPRPDERSLTTATAVLHWARTFGEYLDVAVRVDDEPINADPVWARATTDAEASRLMDIGTELVGHVPLAAIPLAVPGTDLQGTAFVLPYPPGPHAHQANRVYLGRMLVTDACDNLLPDWAFFVRCVVTTTAANPTASREQLVDDDALAILRQGLGGAIRQWVERIGREQPDLLEEFVAVHHLGLRSVAIHDRTLAAIIVPWLPFETSAGRMQLRQFVARWPTVRFVADHTEFDTAATLADADEPIVNAGYVYDLDIMREVPFLMPGAECVQVNAASVLDGLASPALTDQVAAGTLGRRADEALGPVGCVAVVRRFEPPQSTAFLVADAALWLRLERNRARAVPGLWSSMLGAMSESAPAVADEPEPALRLCLNWSNPTVRKLAMIADDVVASRLLKVIYCQAVLAAHRPLAEKERDMLTESLDALLELSIMEENDQ